MNMFIIGLIGFLFFGAITSSLDEDEYKLHTASIGFCSESTVNRLILISLSAGCKVAHDCIKAENRITIMIYLNYETLFII